jgi:hypothetical protein
MIAQLKTFAPEHAIIFIADATRHGEIPIDTGAGPVTATASCICVWTRMEAGGGTTVKLAATFEQPDGNVVFDGVLETPGRQIGVFQTGREAVLSMPVRSSTTHVKVWTNDPSEPDLILIQAQ